jgi:peptidoglycan/LPS O-acetylase OafA/YrhL
MNTLVAPVVKKVELKKYDFNLESLRGVAALLVVWYHAFSNNSLLDPSYQVSGFWAYSPPGHLSVLAFFMLSGYVIGLSHTVPLTKSTIIIYLKKRFIRIYPIYIVCLLLALSITFRTYPLSTITSHLTMTQVLTSPLVTEFAPAWSLNYEIIFYLLFIPISIYKINPAWAALTSIILGCTNAYLYPQVNFPLISSYAFGATFWLCGLILAKYCHKLTQRPSYAAMLAVLLLLMAIEKFNVLHTVLTKAITNLLNTQFAFSTAVPWDQRSISFLDLAYLPYCLLAITLFTSKDLKYRRLMACILVILPSYTFCYIYKHYDNQAIAPTFLSAIFYIMSIIVYIFKNQFESGARLIIKKLSVFGNLSYGLYLVHFPILFIFNRITFFSGSPYTFIIRFICFLSLSIVMAYFLEKKYQPWVKTIINR